MTFDLSAPGRLELVPGTPELARAEARGAAAGDFAELCAHLGVGPAPEWPPELFDDGARNWFLERMTADPAHAAWYCPWFPVWRGTTGSRLVGCGGFKGLADATGSVELGYSILPSYQRRGFATELVRGLCRWAFAQAGVRRVTAETLPTLVASVGVLEKCGFTLVGPGSEPGSILYERLPGEGEPA